MKEFKVCIEETYTKYVYINAVDADNAYEMATDMYLDGKIVFDANDDMDCRVDVVEELE